MLRPASRLGIVGFNPNFGPGTQGVTPKFALNIKAKTLTVTWARVPIQAHASYSDTTNQAWAIRPVWYQGPNDYLVAKGVALHQIYVLAGRYAPGTKLFHTVVRVGTTPAANIAARHSGALQNPISAPFH